MGPWARPVDSFAGAIDTRAHIPNANTLDMFVNKNGEYVPRTGVSQGLHKSPLLDYTHFREQRRTPSSGTHESTVGWWVTLQL